MATTCLSARSGAERLEVDEHAVAEMERAHQPLDGRVVLSVRRTHAQRPVRPVTREHCNTAQLFECPIELQSD